MAIKRINADDGTEASGAYTQALEVRETTRKLYISGQLTVVLAGMFEDGWLLEIDAIAEK